MPRTCTFDSCPSTPSLLSAMTTTTSPAPWGAPPGRFLTPGAAKIRPLYLVSILLESSASEPLRSTSALSGLPELTIVRRMPLASIRLDASTKTTSAMPPAVASVVVLRTKRLRTLYARGMNMA